MFSRQAGFDLWHRIDSGAYLFNAMNRLTPRMAWLMSTLALVVVAALDYLSNVELMISPFYAIPCFLMDWRIGRGAALAYGVFASIVQWLIGTLGGHPYSTQWYFYWDIVLNLIFYGVLIWIVAKLRLALEMEQLLSRADFLTRLANRKTFLGLLDGQLAGLRETGGTLLVISVNLDRFANFNQEQGYTVGDLALGAVADLFRRKAAAEDVLGRSDNSEFTITRRLDGDLNVEAAAESLRKQLEMLMLLRGWQLTFSLAVARFELPPQTAHGVMGKVRVLLEEARRLGKNRCVVRAWDADQQWVGSPQHASGPFVDFEATGQIFLDSGHRPL